MSPSKNFELRVHITALSNFLCYFIFLQIMYQKITLQFMIVLLALCIMITMINHDKKKMHACTLLMQVADRSLKSHAFILL